MDLFNRNTNKRKFNKSNEQSVGCFKRCCTRKKHEIISIQNEKIIKTDSECINQPLKDENVSNILKLSSLYNESEYDPCIECNVQYTPDVWENIPENSNTKLYDNKTLSIERMDVLQNIRNVVTSCISDNIGDGVDRISVIITTISTNRNKQKKFKIDNQSSINSEKNFQPNELKENPSDIKQTKQNLDFIHPHQSISSSANILDEYNWNLASNETNFDQEPYNWDNQEYQWSQTPQLVNKLINNNDTTDPSHNVASVLSSKKRKLGQSSSNFNNRNQPEASPISKFRIKSKHSEQQIDHEDWISTNSSLSENKDLLPRINSTHSASLSSGILYQTETDKQNNQLNTTSANDLVNQIKHAKKASDVDNNNDSKNNVPTVLTEKLLPISSNTKTKHAQSHMIDTQEDQQTDDNNINNPFNQLRSTYDDIMNSWRSLLERILRFMSPSIPNTDHNINNLSPSIMTSNTRSWSTFVPTESLNMTQSDNIGPWWDRHDVYDLTPAIFIFTNESSSTIHSTETITNNTQMCVFIDNRPHCLKYSSYPNTHHCCYNSSITINNNSSSF